MKRRAMLRIQGRVQGVFFRESTRREAVRLGLTGQVKNLADGCVEAIAEGEEAGMDEFIHWCHKGPPLAHVAGVQVSEGSPTGEFFAFTVES